MISRLLFLLFALCLVPVAVYAVTGGEVQVATNGQDTLERSSAYRTGLRWLLNNRADELGALDRELVNVVLDEAENYVDAFEFIELPEQQSIAAIPVTAKVREVGAATHLLSVQYSVAAITAALSIESDVVDETLQPSVRSLSNALLWMLIRDGNTDLIVSDATTPGVASRLRELAGGYGWTIDFPELDVTDLAFIGPDEINDASQADVAAEPVGLTLSPQLLQASQRYDQELVLTATAAKDAAGAWQLRMRRDFARPDATIDQTFRAPLTASGPNLDRLLQQAMSWNAGLSGTDPGTVSDNSNTVAGDISGNGLTDSGARIYVAGIDGAAQYLRLMNIVNSVAGVEQTNALEIGQNSLMIGVSPRSALASVSSSLQTREWLRLASRDQLQQEVATSTPGTLTGTQNVQATSDSATDPETASGVAASEQPAVATPQRSVAAPRLPAADLFLQVVN